MTKSKKKVMLLTNNLLKIQNESQPGSQVKTVNHTRTFYLGINCQNFLFWCTIDQSLPWDKINLMADDIHLPLHCISQASATLYGNCSFLTPPGRSTVHPHSVKHSLVHRFFCNCGWPNFHVRNLQLAPIATRVGTCRRDVWLSTTTGEAPPHSFLLLRGCSQLTALLLQEIIPLNFQFLSFCCFLSWTQKVCPGWSSLQAPQGWLFLWKSHFKKHR